MTAQAGTAEDSPAADIVDWELAARTARKLLRPGPETTREEAGRVVAELRRFAADSEEHVRDFTGLHATAATAPVMVVDRAGWVQANADGFRTVLRPLAVKLAARQDRGIAFGTTVGSRVTAVETGALLAFLSGKVLGQFDPFYGVDSGTGDTGRLLLVAPNVVQIEQELGVDPSAYLSMLRDAMQRLGRSLRGEGDFSVIDLLQSPEQRAVLDRLTGVMSLLEGHADVVMDGVGPRVIPTVGHIRSKFDQRRRSGNPFDHLVKRLLGLDAKLRQYTDGASFVRHVVDRAGMADFNAVWSGPDALPTKAEITDPDAWLRRVHG